VTGMHHLRAQSPGSGAVMDDVWMYSM
jgi:hypothetical protein